MKRIIAGIMALCLCGMSMPLIKYDMPKNIITAQAAPPPQYEKCETELYKYYKYEDHIELYEYNDKDAEEIVIPDMIDDLPVTYICTDAFAYCTMTSVKLPDTVTVIDDRAFCACFNLKSVEIPDSVVYLGEFAFSGCFELESLKLPSGLEKIPAGLLISCHSITEFEIPDSVKTIGSNAFSHSGLRSINIPENVVAIDENAFSSCDYLTEMTVSEDNKYYSDIGGVLFGKSKKNLVQYPGGRTDAEYIVPDGTVTVDYASFANCDKLTSISFPESLRKISSWAFENCAELTKVTFSEGFETISTGAFRNCEKLAEIEFPKSLKEISNSAFSGCDSLTEITIPENVELLGEASDPFACCKSLTDINVAKENENFCSIGGVVFSKDKKTLVAYPNGSEASAYAVPDGVELIRNDAFSYTENLKIIGLPETVVTIDSWAFNCSSLESIELPKSVSKIDSCAFKECENLKSITIENPDCNIADEAEAICNELDFDTFQYRYDGIIYGEKGSTAEKYAEKYGYRFAEIEERDVESELLYGDANCDGKVTIADSTAILQHLGNEDKYGLSDKGKKNADVDGKNGVTGNDAITIQMVDAKMLTVEELPLK